MSDAAAGPAAGHEIASHSRNHANAFTYCQGNTTGCTLGPEERAGLYIQEQALTDIADMALDGIHPRSFAYPYGEDLAQTTSRLLELHDYVRDTSYYPNHQRSYVACGGSRFIAGLGARCRLLRRLGSLPPGTGRARFTPLRRPRRRRP